MVTDPDKIDRAASRTRAQSGIAAMLGIGLGYAWRLGLDFAADRPARRPWRLVGRSATRARWRRQGRW